MRRGGAQGSENVGMSNVKMRENRIRRKSKVSYATLFDVGLAGPKPRPQGVGDGKRVNIPVPVVSHLTEGGTEKGSLAGCWTSRFKRVGGLRRKIRAAIQH